MRFLAIIYFVASSLILASLFGNGAFAHPLGEELATAQKIDDLTGRTLVKFALLDGRAILGTRTQLCDCCSEHNNNDSDCCGEDYYGTCSCYCCDGCAANEAGDLMKLVAAKKRAVALKEAQLKRSHVARAQSSVVKKDSAINAFSVSVSPSSRRWLAQVLILYASLDRNLTRSEATTPARPPTSTVAVSLRAGLRYSRQTAYGQEGWNGGTASCSS